jgi:hypothetical protein
MNLIDNFLSAKIQKIKTANNDITPFSTFTVEEYSFYNHFSPLKRLTITDIFLYIDILFQREKILLFVMS